MNPGPKPAAKTLLIVEDDPDFQRVLRSLLTEAGYLVLSAADGATALKLARERRPDMVLLDLNLPDTDGFELCRVLRAAPATARTPIIMVTVQSRSDQFIAGLKLGADDYVAKPFDPDEVLARVRALFRQAEGGR